MPFTVGLCAKIQETLVKIAGTENTGYTSRQPVGFLDAIVSPYNREGFTQINPNNGNGGKRPVEVQYIKPLLATAIVDTPADVCAGALEMEPFVKILNPEDFEYFGTPGMKLSYNEVMKLCGTDNDAENYRSRMIMGMINGLNTRINQYLLTTQNVNWGNFYGTGSSVAIAAPIIAAADGSIRVPGWVASVSASLNSIRITRPPLIVGGGLVYQYAMMAQWGCCNNAGINLAAATQNLYYFNDIESSTAPYWGANVFGAFSPGAMQLVTYNANNQVTNQESDTFVFGNVIDPVTGLNYDFKLIFDPCDGVNGTWRFSMGVEVNLWHLPPDMYAATDPMFGANGTLRFTATTA